MAMSSQRGFRFPGRLSSHEGVRRIGNLNLPHLGLIALALFVYNPATVHERVNLLIWHHAGAWIFLMLTACSLLVHHRRSFAGFQQIPPLLQRIYLALGLFGVWAILSAVVGLANGHPLLSVVADLSQILTWIASVWLAAQVTLLYGETKLVLGVILVGYLATMSWEFAGYILEVFEAPLPIELTLRPIRLGEVRMSRSVFSVVPVILPVVAACTLVPRLKRRGASILTVLLGVATILSVLCTLVTFSRTAWVGSLVSLQFLAVWSVVRYGRAMMWRITYQSAILILATVTTFNVLTYEGESFTELTVDRVTYTKKQIQAKTKNVGVRSRVTEYDVILNGLRENPMLGRGLGAHYKGLQRGKLKTKHFFHNTYGAVAFRMGIPGLAFFLLALATIAFPLTVRSLRLHSLFRFALVTGALATLLSYGLQSITRGDFFAHPIPILLGLVVGLAAATASRNSLDATPSSTPEAPSG